MLTLILDDFSTERAGKTNLRDFMSGDNFDQAWEICLSPDDNDTDVPKEFCLLEATISTTVASQNEPSPYFRMYETFCEYGFIAPCSSKDIYSERKENTNYKQALEWFYQYSQEFELKFVQPE